MVEIYVPGIGQYDNIGDIILRRQLLRWLEPLGRLHVFVGNAPEGYAESLELGGDHHRFYRSFGAWYKSGLRDAVRGKAAYVFKPGEIQITLVGMKEHVSMVPLQLSLKARSQPVVRVGAGARGFDKLPRLLMKPSLALTDLIAWRDPRTASFTGTGEVMPDLAFGEGAPRPRGVEKRDLMIVSMRSDRPLPSDAWFDAVRLAAEERNLEIVSIVQVERDSERSRELTARLGGRHHPWPGGDHESHEEALRKLYRRANVTVSDRLHVLITSLTEGSAPFAPLVDDSDKIERHFDAAGIPSVAIRTRGLGAAAIKAALDDSADNWERTETALTEARVRLENVRTRVEALITGGIRDGADDVRATVWHVGRRGEVAGGMTQVVNAFLAWPFARVRQRLLVSRDGSTGPRALALFAGAVARLPFLGRRDRTIVAVHLSQKGSFVREGMLLRLASRLGYRTVAHLHGSSFVKFAKASPGSVVPTLQRADLIAVLSPETRDTVRRLVPSADVELLPNSVPRGSARGKEKTVVFGGGITRRKGVDVLVEAWRAAAPSAPWRLLLAGPALETDLVADLPEGVTHLGPLPHAELMSLLERSSVAVLPSRDEAMPMFILEALARRNAVVSTTVGGIPEVLADGAGVLVEPGDAEALAAALGTVTSDDAARDALADRGFARFEQEFDASATYPRIESHWLSVLN